MTNRELIEHNLYGLMQLWSGRGLYEEATNLTLFIATLKTDITDLFKYHPKKETILTDFLGQSAGYLLNGNLIENEHIQPISEIWLNSLMQYQQ